MTDTLASADEWLRHPDFEGIVVMDPDGWDRKNYKASWAEKITRAEFEERLMESTCMRPMKMAVKLP